MKNLLSYFTLHHAEPLETRLSVKEKHSAIPTADAGFASAERSVLTDIGGNLYRMTSDDNYLNDIKGEFEPDMVMLFNSLISSSQCVLDVGANIGCTSILFGSRENKVFSFEPSPTTFKFLEKNILAAGLANITPMNIGFGKSNGACELTFSPDNRSGGFISNQINASDGHQVEQIKIMKGDDFVKSQDITRVDFIKIDVEGFEKDVIEGLRETIKRDNPAVALELNHWCLNAFQRLSVPDFFDYLREIFPYLYAVDKSDIRNLHNVNETYHVLYQHIVNNFKYPNLVGAFHRNQLSNFSKMYGVNVT